MSVTVKANAAGTQGEVLLNGTPVQTFNQNVLQVSGNVLAGAAQNTDPAALTRKDYVDGLNRQSLTGNGYVKLPGGLIVQWGSNSTLSTGQATIPFPVSFTAAPVVVATVGQTPQSQFAFAQVSDISITGFGLGSIQHDGVRISMPGVKWIAIGY